MEKDGVSELFFRVNASKEGLMKIDIQGFSTRLMNVVGKSVQKSHRGSVISVSADEVNLDPPSISEGVIIDASYVEKGV